MTAITVRPQRHDAVLFDLDGVLTDTASVHCAAWKRLFDHYLAARAGHHEPFTTADYLDHVDGKPRADGVLDFLRSRRIELPRGAPSDRSDAETAVGLGKRKDRYFRDALATGGVRVFDGAIGLLVSLWEAHLRIAVVSASRNCALVLESAGLTGLVDVVVDGVVADELGLPGKPDPATFLEAARRCGCRPSRSAVVEDSSAGVRAARAGGFGLVIGVARVAAPHDLRDVGADVVARSLCEISVTTSGRPWRDG